MGLQAVRVIQYKDLLNGPTVQQYLWNPIS